MVIAVNTRCDGDWKEGRGPGGGVATRGLSQQGAYNSGEAGGGGAMAAPNWVRVAGMTGKEGGKYTAKSKFWGTEMIY